jgi:hypothetical protein
MSPGLVPICLERLFHKDGVHTQTEQQTNREPDEGVSQAPDQPFPGKTAKSASPVASPSQGLCLPMHVNLHTCWMRSGTATLPQVIDFISFEVAMAQRRVPFRVQSTYPNG